MKIYFAAPLFSQAEKEFNQVFCNELESIGFEVFLPQRDGVEKNAPPYDKMDKEERRMIMFGMDRDKIMEADIFLFILDGRVPDEGACVEFGIAYTSKYINNIKKIIIGLHTDNRAAFIDGKLNPMLKVPMDYITESKADLIKFLKSKKIVKKPRKEIKDF